MAQFNYDFHPKRGNNHHNMILTSRIPVRMFHLKWRAAAIEDLFEELDIPGFELVDLAYTKATAKPFVYNINIKLQVPEKYLLRNDYTIKTKRQINRIGLDPIFQEAVALDTKRNALAFDLTKYDPLFVEILTTIFELASMKFNIGGAR